jgi:hypothetical protein
LHSLYRGVARKWGFGKRSGTVKSGKKTGQSRKRYVLTITEVVSKGREEGIEGDMATVTTFFE